MKKKYVSALVMSVAATHTKRQTHTVPSPRRTVPIPNVNIILTYPYISLLVVARLLLVRSFNLSARVTS